jgi:uncharacterized protein with PIN domain
LADGMLGKLTRWLRMIGCDVEYFTDLDDDELIEFAATEERVLLTRDIQLLRRASVNGVEVFLIKGQTETEKLADLAKRFDIKLEIDANNSRCPKCNITIDPVSKGEIKDQVPQSTFRFYNEFWICPNCDKIYWRGSHWKRIDHTLLEAKRRLELSRKLKQNS